MGVYEKGINFWGKIQVCLTCRYLYVSLRICPPYFYLFFIQFIYYEIIGNFVKSYLFECTNVSVKSARIKTQEDNINNE